MCIRDRSEIAPINPSHRKGDMKVSQICYVKHYQELVESIKRAALDEDEKTIVIESDITIKETILIENCKNLTITSSRMPVMKGGIESEKWIQKGTFLTMKVETEPRILLINGEWRKKSCYPAEGYLELTDQTEHEWMNSRNGGWDSPPTMEELTHITVQKKDKMCIRDRRCAPWRRLTG